MTRFLILLIAVLIPMSAEAVRAYSRVIPSGFDRRVSLSDLLAVGCTASLNSAGSYGNIVTVGGSSDWGAIASGTGLLTAPLGTVANVTCTMHQDAVFQGTANLAITVVTICPVNVPTFGIMQTTIATWNGIEATPADVMPNPQCNNSCIVEHPTGVSGALCDGYVLSGVAVAVGVTEWVVCQGAGFVFTGATCNYASSDYTGITNAPLLPANAVDVAGSGPAVTAAVDTSETCLDVDANGYDDDSGVACSVLAAAQLDALTTLKKTQMDNVGNGATMPGDVNALAAQNGGIFSWPQALLNFLNPPATCDFQFVLNALPMLAPMNVTAGWCSIKTAVEPFLAFGMWVITIFVSAGFFQRVS